jgi:microsomal dipeptidase-like Zn-dependent dipeptidase
MIRAFVLALAFAFLAAAQPWDFETAAFRGWTQTGRAFAGQPFCKKPGDRDMPSTRFSDARLGGDYWQAMEYPLAQHGNCVVTSLLKIPGAGPWSLTSPEFTLRPETPYLSLLVGGSGDAAHQRVELQVRRNGEFVATQSFTGRGLEQLHQEVFTIPESDRGLPARIRILDDSPEGHINVDFIQLTDRDHIPPAPHPPVWGYADYHTHPMTHLAFGSIPEKRRQIIWGDPGGSYDDYIGDPLKVAKDIPHCYRGHGGGYIAEAFINNAQLFSDDTSSIINAFLFPHKRSGGPEFADFPGHLMGAHEQMHITMIRRNYEGGLRLMAALVTDNWGAAFLTGETQNGALDLVHDKDTIVKQVEWMKQQAERNRSWMQIAYSPAEARRIIAENKLAIVLGVEVDQLGEFHLGSPAEEPRLEADFLWDKGVRIVTPIHAVNNLLGGPAILNAPYNWLNDFTDFVRKNQRLPVRSDIKDDNGVFFKVDRHECTKPQEGECVVHKLDPSPQLRLAIGRNIFTLFRREPEFVIKSNPDYKEGRGFTNQQGLTDFGKAYLRALMARGMIVDTAHMSDNSVRETYAVLAERPGYPAIISHAHFRKEGLYDPDTPIADYLASEYDISDTNLDLVRRNGGVIGPFLHQARINPDSIDIHISHITDDCGNSSKGYAFAYHYANQKVPGGLGMASDMTFIPVVSPRFGEHACEGFKSFRHGQAERAKHPERYQPKAQKDPVLYEGIPIPANVPKTNQSDPLKPYKAGIRTFDFNYDGLAHFGLVPDMLQDLKNVNMTKHDFEAIFGSAEAYLQMWEKTERARGSQ